MVLFYGLVALLLEGFLWLSGRPSYWQLLDQTFGLPQDERAVARELQQAAQRSGRGFRVRGTSYWLYEPSETQHLRINSLGLRGPEIERRRGEEWRIAVFGGSSVYGWLVADDQTVPALLQETLARQNPARRVTVFNLGVEGFRFQQEVELAEALVDRLDVDLLVFLHGANDTLATALEAGYREAEVWQGGRSEADLLVTRYRRPEWWAPLVAALKHSRLASFAFEARLRWLARAPPRRPVAVMAEELVQGYGELHRRLGQLVTAKEIDAVLFMQPVVFTKPEPTRLERMRALYASAQAPGLEALDGLVREAILEQEGPVAVVDLGDVFDSENETVFQDGVHLSPRGNAEVARAIAAYLMALEEDL